MNLFNKTVSLALVMSCTWTLMGCQSDEGANESEDWKLKEVPLLASVNGLYKGSLEEIEDTCDSNILEEWNNYSSIAAGPPTGVIGFNNYRNFFDSEDLAGIWFIEPYLGVGIFGEKLTFEQRRAVFDNEQFWARVQSRIKENDGELIKACAPKADGSGSSVEVIAKQIDKHTYEFEHKTRWNASDECRNFSDQFDKVHSSVEKLKRLPTSKCQQHYIQRFELVKECDDGDKTTICTVNPTGRVEDTFMVSQYTCACEASDGIAVEVWTHNFETDPPLTPVPVKQSP